MTAFDLSTFLVSFAVALAATWTLVMLARSTTRSRPLLSLAETGVGPAGLSLLRNEGQTPASGIEIRVGGEHDGTVVFHHDAIGPGAVVLMAHLCPAGSHYAVDLSYRDAGAGSYSCHRTLRRAGASPLRIVSATDHIVRRRLRDWYSDVMMRQWRQPVEIHAADRRPAASLFPSGTAHALRMGFGMGTSSRYLGVWCKDE